MFLLLCIACWLHPHLFVYIQFSFNKNGVPYEINFEILIYFLVFSIIYSSWSWFDWIKLLNSYQYYLIRFEPKGVALLQKICRSLRSMLLILLVFCVLLVWVFTFWVPCCDFRIQPMFGSSLPPVVCKRTHILLTLFVLACG